MKRRIKNEELINQHHKLTKEEIDTKYRIIDQIILRGEPIPVKELPMEEAVLASITKKGAIVIEAGIVNFAYPVSALETVHQVLLSDGRKFSSMCAIDALGTAFAFGQDVEIQDQCAMTGEPIRLVIRDGKITERSSDEIHVIHVDLKAFDN